MGWEGSAIKLGAASAVTLVVLPEVPKLKVLVVDDDPVLLRSLRKRLERAGYEVDTRDAAIGTSEWILRNQPDIVLLDVVMPALSGPEVAQVLRRHGLSRRVGVILHSGLAPAELELLRQNSGAIGVLQKGLDDARFLHELEQLSFVLARRRARMAAGA